MPDVGLRSKTTSPRNDSWSLIDNRGAQALPSDKATRCPFTPRATMLEPVSLPGDALAYLTSRLQILNNDTFHNSFEGRTLEQQKQKHA